MSVVRVSANKDVRAEARILMSLGFEFVGFRNCGRSHPYFRHPVYGEIGMADTPSDRNWRKAHRRKLAQLMGVTVGALEARLAGQNERGKGSGKRAGRRKSPRPRPVPPRHLATVLTAAPSQPPVVVVEVPPAPEDHRAPITSKRRARWARLADELERANAEARMGPLTERRAA